jgi:hypothetical protein
MFRTWRDMLEIKGSGEHRSIHGLEYAINWETVSPGVKGVSTGVSGGIIGAGGVLFVAASSEHWELESSERYVDIKVKTLEWKWGLVMGLVSISYWSSLAAVLKAERGTHSNILCLTQYKVCDRQWSFRFMVTDIKGGRKIIYRRRRVVVGARRLLRGGHRSIQKTNPNVVTWKEHEKKWIKRAETRWSTRE